MFEKLNFYVRHSVNDLRVNGQRTFFALLCIAAGVAAVVSLQTVAVMIGDTLTGNLQETNRGDILVSLPNAFIDSDDDGNGDQQAELEQGAVDGFLEAQPASSFFGQDGPPQYRIGASGIASLQAWIDENYPGQIELTYPWVISDFAGLFTGGVGTSVTASSTGAIAGQVTPIMIDPTIYPFYGEVTAVDGTPLADLIQSPTDIVIDRKVADTLGAAVGDTLRINGANADFTLRGIVPTESEVTDPASGLFVALYGFYYLDREAIQYFDGLAPQTDKLYLRLSDPTQTAEINRALLTAFPYL
ncbi:MAG: ABC transporter permease, partial [Burkholderiales bacterium]|nr:ABC transporter permease [Anaerolineae bacterium]